MAKHFISGRFIFKNCHRVSKMQIMFIMLFRKRKNVFKRFLVTFLSVLKKMKTKNTKKKKLLFAKFDIAIVIFGNKNHFTPMNKTTRTHIAEIEKSIYSCRYLTYIFLFFYFFSGFMDFMMNAREDIQQNFGRHLQIFSIVCQSVSNQKKIIYVL